MKRHTDFNDHATQRVLGKDGVERQVRAVVNQVLEERQ